MNWHDIMAISAKSYYLILIEIAMGSYFIIYGIGKFRKLGDLKILVIYSTLSVLQTISSYYVGLTDRLINNSINIFMIIEFFVFFVVIFRTLTSRPLRILFILSAAFFTCAVFYYWSFTEEFSKNPSKLTTIESLIFIVLSFLYFYHSFKSTSPEKKWIEPQFWIVSGILLLFCCIFPLFLLLDYLSTYFPDIVFNIYSLNYFGYLILFIFFLWGARAQVRLHTAGHSSSHL